MQLQQACDSIGGRRVNVPTLPTSLLPSSHPSRRRRTQFTTEPPCPLVPLSVFPPPSDELYLRQNSVRDRKDLRGRLSADVVRLLLL